MVGKRFKYIWIILIFIIMLVGCKTKDKNRDSYIKINEEKIQTTKDLEFLTSNECGGRKSGTNGNEIAGEYIAKRFKEIGLVPLEQDYALPYIKNVEILNTQNLVFELMGDNSLKSSYIYGEMFYEITLGGDAEFTLPLVETPGDDNCAVLAKDYKEAAEYRKNPNVKLILRNIDNIEKNKRGGSFYIQDAVTELGVISTVYNELKNQIGDKVHFTVDIDIEEMKLNNIVGMLKGKSNSNAIVVSAHFDHIGSAGDTIWRGALDNASGVCTLLVAAKVIQEYYTDTLPLYDIIFCAFNNEETINTGSGSHYFINQIKDLYETVFDINIDCIGNKDYEYLYVIANENNKSKQIKAELLDSFQKAGVTKMKGSSAPYGSDHTQFTYAICLTTLTATNSSVIHTLDDNSDIIDLDFLIEIGKKIGNYLVYDMQLKDFFTSTSSNMKAHNILPVPEQEVENNTFFEILSTTGFEERFDCKLEFVDDKLKSITIGPPINLEPIQDDMNNSAINSNLQDIQMEFDISNNDNMRISLAAFDKNNDLELNIMNALFDLDNKYFVAEPVSIENKEYYLKHNPENNTKTMATFYENESLIILIRVSFSPMNTDDFDIEDYINYFEENVPKQYISGMVDLILGKD